MVESVEGYVGHGVLPARESCEVVYAVHEMLWSRKGVMEEDGEREHCVGCLVGYRSVYREGYK